MSGYCRQSLLACGCWVRLPMPHTRGQTLDEALSAEDRQCTFHGWTTVVLNKLMEYHARCDDCGWSRWFGMDETTAGRAASSHRGSTGHYVRVGLDRFNAGLPSAEPLGTMLETSDESAARAAAEYARRNAIRRAHVRARLSQTQAAVNASFGVSRVPTWKQNAGKKDAG